jgi:hypothetical protein
MTQQELIKQLEDTCYGLDPVDPLRLLVDDVIAALAQTEQDHIPDARKMVTEQEPVAWMFQHDETGRMNYVSNDGIHNPTMFLEMNPRYALVCALYTTPPQRSESSGKPSAWVGLTDEDKKQMAKEANYHWEMTAGEYAELIGHLTEAKLREKNSQHKEKNT